MLKLVKKTAFIGLGLAAMSVSALEQLGGRISKEANLSEEEGEKLVDDLIEQSKKSREELMETVKKTVLDLGIVTSEDLKTIDDRLERIEKSLNQNSTKNTSKANGK
jgi:polyhydroxyalkanoate synthesis regulator phasin